MGVLPYISHVGMCCPKGYGFWVFLVRKRVKALSILAWNQVWFSRELRKHVNIFILSILNEEERTRNMRIQNAFEEMFCLWSNLSNEDIIFLV